MAFDNNQKEAGLPIGSNSKRTTLDFLPKYFRTPANQKFLSATVDQMINEGTVSKVNAFIGRKDTPAHKSTDRYLEEVSVDRQAYQLEPALVSKDSLDNVTFFKDYNDYINQLQYFANNNNIDHNKVNSAEFYAWNPHIDWDKFVNYREYYWLPTGPQAITVLGQSTDISSTYTVTLSNEVDNIAYVFTPDGLTRNPTFKLYRGQTYNFEIDCPTRPIAFKTVRTAGDGNLYSTGITLLDENGKEILDADGAKVNNIHITKGTIRFTVPNNAPNVLYYASQNDVDTSGFFTVYDITDATEIAVDVEIVGKKHYTTGSGISLSNGMKLTFIGHVTPAKYAKGNWYVEGVGTSINLVSEFDLSTPAQYTASLEIEFDNENFDTQGFDVNNNFPKTKDYITINRGSKDSNPWSRHNRWFHRSVIETSAIANNQPTVIDQNARAKRPIIEFEPNMQLWNFGKISKQSVTVVDTFTKDVFSTIEGSFGYNVDGVTLVDGMRVLFTADTDARVSGRIFKIAFVTHIGERRITLLPETDTDPAEGEIVLATEGNTYRGTMFHYMDGLWMQSQDKTKVNQSPLFDVVDPTGTSYGNTVKYPGTTFLGCKLFSYTPGTTYDTELGFNITYRNIGNFGDIVFEFNLHTDKHTYQNNNMLIDIKPELGYLRLNYSLTSFDHANGWAIAIKNSLQNIIRQYDIDRLQNMFPIDTYDNSGDLTDLEVKIYLNGVKKYETDYTIEIVNHVAYIQFFTDLVVGDVLIIKTQSSAPRVNGYYEFPSNLENNPQNLSLTTFTLGEINNHVSSIADSIPNFVGTVPGKNSLRDLGNITPYGNKIIQHSASLLPVAYHVTSKDHNIINALKTARLEYAKFKRNLLRKATDYGYDGLVRNHLDLILKEVTKDFTTHSPYYLSDMFAIGASFIFDQEVIDNSITEYPLIFNFDLKTSSEKSVLIYLNEDLLLHGTDYVFISNNFVQILKPIATGDNLKVIQYEKTDGCFLPPTPTKLGLYPKFVPQMYIDSTYQTPTKVIQGHDGSITIAFNDFRDDLLLEFEKRIYNNIKSEYNTKLFDLYDFISGYGRKSNLAITDINAIMVGDFLHWSNLISNDYTRHSFFNSTLPNTYNYKEFRTDTGEELPGFWRGIFKFLYDTDRPHTHPWEMLGYSVEPGWWQTVYGPAPYTRNNLILWEDLADGLIKEPGKPLVKNEKFSRPFLMTALPVDEDGNLLPPTDINIINGFTTSLVEGEFRFGDHAPIETAWRRSSEYPFSLLTALTTLRPAKVFASCFDRVRQYRDDTGQLVYKVNNGNLRFNISNLVLPSTPDDSTRVFTCGLVNYIVDYVIGRQSITEVDTYRSEVSNLVARLSSKLGGFTTKEKFKLILDSRSPLNTSNVFVPDENYNIILNTSSPVNTVDYSAVIIEKQNTGFIISGYNKFSPVFKYFKPVIANNDYATNIGGISETFIVWGPEKYFIKDSIVSYDGAYYKTQVSHTSSTIFEIKYFTKLSKLPITGGRDVIIRSKFNTDVLTLHYGAELTTIQDVVDFLLGYGSYLESVGFKFENFNNVIRNVTDFQTSAKEFAFWTTQRWSAGAIISLSPCAEEVKFSQSYSVVDNIYDNFYEYSVLKQDGTALSSIYTGNAREGNLFTLRPKNTADGIYHVSLNLVQKEHVLILDNTTIFNDTIYDQLQGYRQERIKVVGYRTSDWQGDFDIPGFVYDKAEVKFWEPWTDFALGDTIKYKEFYYSAKTNVPGSQNFIFNSWNKLSSRPDAKLIPNWDYRANQFADFYDLDTDSFDLDQQKFAQHLIGYQKRQYLENIINDDVSQYKFYQGYITEKGTENSFSKLFDALSTSTGDSLEFYEEWAVRIGQYGSNLGFEEVEFLLDENKFLINPQPIELTKAYNLNLLDFVYRILPDQVYLKPSNYTHRPFPTKTLLSNYVSTAGYVCPEDTEIKLNTLADIVTVDINTLEEGYYFWVAYEKNTWNVFRFTLFENSVRLVEPSGTSLRIKLNRLIDTDINVGDYIGINNSVPALEGFHKVITIEQDYFEIQKPVDFTTSVTALPLQLNLFKLVSVRLKSFEEINNIGIPKKKTGDLVWLDGTKNNWSVWKYEKDYVVSPVENTKPYFGITIAVDSNDTTLATTSINAVSYYIRPSAKTSWAFKDEIGPVTTQNVENSNPALLWTNNSFGNSVVVSKDGRYLAIGAYKANVDLLVVGSTSATGNLLTLAKGNLNNFDIGSIVTFATGAIGGAELNKKYYLTYKQGTRFKISETPGGPDVVLESRNGSMSMYSNQGYVSLYVKNNNGYFDYSNLITAKEKSENEYFGSNVAISNDVLIVASQGSSNRYPTLTAFRITSLIENKLDTSITSNNAIVDSPYTFDTVPLGTTLNSMSVADNGNIILAFSNGVVKVHNISAQLQLSPVQTITSTDVLVKYKDPIDNPNGFDNGSYFGNAISVTNDGTKLAIGARNYSGNFYFNNKKISGHYAQGAVVVYKNVPSSFTSWEVTIPDLVPTSGITLTGESSEISLGIKEITIRRGGSGLRLNTVASFGVLRVNPTIASNGTGYRQGDTVIIVGGNNNATYKITNINNTTGAVTAGELLTKGTNYFGSAVSNTTPKPLVIQESQQVTLTHNNANYMIGVAVSYNDTTATLVVNIKETYTPGQYVPVEVLTTPFNRPNEHFGSTVSFNANADQLAIGSEGGRQRDDTTLDVYSKHLTSSPSKYVNDPTSPLTNAPTTFDLEATTFLENELGVGSVVLYDHYESKFIFSDALEVGNAVGINYGATISMTNKIYVSDFTSTTGTIYEFSSPTKSWYKFRELSQTVNVDKIKSVFLYDTEENQIITYLDVVDPLQGKILGIAEQELKFKTYYDPATYSNGNDLVVVDPLMCWENKEVGHLWWDLSSSKYLDPNQGTIVYKANTWNNTFNNEYAEVYEWVSSEYKPSEWDKLADTELGLTLGISGKSKYQDECYSVNKAYDTVSKTASYTYYFWVKNKAVVPNIENRNISAKDVAKYISDPKNMGVSYIALHDNNQFSLVNCKPLITGKKIALNIRYWIIDNFEQSNSHSHYQLMSTSSIDKSVNPFIEQKWFDSLSGFDSLGNEVPDPKIPVKLKYGIQTRPRQSMFVNRVEALKQFIERVNSVLVKKSIIDDFDFSSLNSKDLPPNINSGKFDYEVSTYSQIRFVGTNEIGQATLLPIIESGKIVRVEIVNQGKGYINPPEVVITGIGTGAKIKTIIGAKGQITSALVETTGQGYLLSTKLSVRTLSVLVTADETANNRWSLYSWNTTKKTWFREKSQTYDTTRYWKYIDWYQTGYNAFTKLDHIVDFIYQLPSTTVNIGEVVKVKNQGVGGWVLLEKIDNQDVLETTVNYKTIGRENGTIQFNTNLYNFAANSSGFDGPTFDSYVFDDQPKTELKIILKCIKDNIFIDDLASEYKELFFASIRYAFSEQKTIDWAFKTSFVRSKHNLGALEQKPTYQNDNLASYQEYINEVKPYRSKIREFISNYEVLEKSHSQITDFDLSPRYVKDENVVKTFETKITNGVLSYDSPDIKKYPYTDWLFNTGFNLVDIAIIDGGSGYQQAPQVTIEGASTSIFAKAYISAGKVTKILITDPYYETFLYTPKILIDGSVGDTGTPARAVAILKNSLVRSTKIGIKFDRLSASATFTSLNVTETFKGTGSRTRFELAWPIDIVKNKVIVSDNNGEVLGADYTVFNEIDTSYPYTRYKGVLKFNTAPNNLTTNVIKYYKNISLLDAADRITHFYKPLPGQLGKDLGQLMQGVDYGGVEITGIGFDIGSGWDALPWFTTGYDTLDPEFTDFLIRSDGVTRSFNLSYAPTEIEYINVYWIGNRVSITAAYNATSGAIASTSLVLESVAGIIKGQTVSGYGIQSNTVVSSISGVTVTLTKSLVETATGVYTFRANDSFNKRLDDPNYSVVKPLLDRLNNLKAELIDIKHELITAQSVKDTNTELKSDWLEQYGIVYDLRAAAIDNNESQQVIDNLNNQLDILDDEILTATNNIADAVTTLATANSDISALSGTSTLASVRIVDLFGRVVLPNSTYIVGQSITITGAFTSGSIENYVSGKTYYIGEVINRTSVRLTSTYDNAVKTIPVLDLISEPGYITPGATAVLHGKIDTLQNHLNEFTSIVNTDAIMNSFMGDGISAGPVVIPGSVPLQVGDTIILRKSTSDGSFKPSDVVYDTQLLGGDFSYLSATGLAPEDINVDGDGFVTPMTSHAPEEVVPGQVVDTVDITVYNKAGDGAPVIKTVCYETADDSIFDIGQRPGTASSVIVKINGSIIKQGVNYSVNFERNQIELITSYPDGLEIVITSISQNGLNILDLDYFIADGETTEYITAARWDTVVTSFVTVNGEAVSVTNFKTDSTYDKVGNIGLRFETAPEVGTVINYTVLGSEVDSISKIQKQTIIHNGTDSSYALTRNPEFNKPLANNVIVEYNGNVLRSTDTLYFTVVGNLRTFIVDYARYAYNTVDSKLVTVTVNGKSLVQGIDYFWFSVSNELKIKKGVAKVGDKVALSINLNADYTINTTDTGTELELFGTYSPGTVITVITFSNHDILDIERQHNVIRSASILTAGDKEYYSFNQLTGGRIKLRKPALGSQYVWITLNKELLTPDYDYVLESNMNYISLKTTTVLLETDVVEVIAFSNKVTKSSFGYKIFKDMLNKNSYSRIDDASSTVLVQPLNFYDKEIVLDNATVLPEPSAKLNKPGVVFIDGERIEYFRKEGNVIRQLKRGTLGTGVKNSYPIGALVRDQSITQTIPYKDEFITEVIVSDGYNSASTIYPNSSAVTISSVTFEGDDQSANYLGNDTVTVVGTGFKINAKVYVGDVECDVTRESDSKLTFITPAKTVGTYDLVIYNPPITAPSTVSTPTQLGVVSSTSLTTTITGLTNAYAKFRLGMVVTKVNGNVGNPSGALGSNAVITEINSDTQITIKSTTANTYGDIQFIGTEPVKTTLVTGNITVQGLVSRITLTGTYLTNGFAVGMMLSRVSGTGNFGAGVIISNIISLTEFEITSTTNNAVGTIVFNVNNQNPTSRVLPGAIQYLKIPLNFAPIKSSVDNWYRDTIPAAYNQCNDIEVFAAGKRLRKSPSTVWSPLVGFDSPAGDQAHEAEFAVNGGTYIRLTSPIAAGQYVIVQKRVGRTWVPEGGNLVNSASGPAKFIRATYALLPDKNKV
jgi:hypothetical protein